MDALANHRQQEILDALKRAGGSLRVGAIATELNVTSETVRRNLRSLVENGVVEKMHGGVRLRGDAAGQEQEEGTFKQRLSENITAKRAIAQTVAGLLPDGASLFLDIGSTTAHIADALRGHNQLTVVTNSIYVASKLAMRNDNCVYMAGGRLRSHDGGAFGHAAMDFAANFNTDFAVMSSAGISAQQGFTLFDLEEAQFSRLILQRAGTRIMAADSSKFGREAPIVIGDPSLVDVLATDKAPPPSLAKAAQGWGISIVTPKGH
jgi:DeoR family glycerol-3-phosphate regulon repressor